VNKKQIEQKQISRLIMGGLRETIRAHGPITKTLIGSATKRIIGILFANKYHHHNLSPESHDKKK